jgi:hypothetical protein
MTAVLLHRESQDTDGRMLSVKTLEIRWEWQV